MLWTSCFRTVRRIGGEREVPSSQQDVCTNKPALLDQGIAQKRQICGFVLTRSRGKIKPDEKESGAEAGCSASRNPISG